MDNAKPFTDEMEKRVDKLAEEIKARDANPDLIDSPSHYMHGSKECIEYIKDVGAMQGYLLGNAIKYIFRHNHKGDPIGDIQKAIRCLDMYIRGMDF